MNTISIIVGSVALALVIWAVIYSWMSETPVDRYEDREQSDRDVQDVVDSARAQLEPTTRRVRGIS